jgi:hypothetical protein
VPLLLFKGRAIAGAPPDNREPTDPDQDWSQLIATDRVAGYPYFRILHYNQSISVAGMLIVRAVVISGHKAETTSEIVASKFGLFSPLKLVSVRCSLVAENAFGLYRMQWEEQDPGYKMPLSRPTNNDPWETITEAYNDGVLRSDEVLDLLRKKG